MSHAEDDRHVVIVNRWRERYAHYADYLDHGYYDVTYVTTEVGTASVPATAAEVVIVDATDNLLEVDGAVRDLARRYGRPSRIVALKEDDLLIGAALREEWDCPGPWTDDLLPFRNKSTMATAVAAAGVPVPPFALVNDHSEVYQFARRHDWPVVVKPLSSSSSDGVERLDAPDAVADLSFAHGPLLVQAFDSRPIYHVDGVFTGMHVAACRASRYLDNCLGFRDGRPLGSVEETDPGLHESILQYTTAILRALTRKATVFHLELFVDRETGACSFLEVGARVGGAEVPFIWREVHDFDLMESACRVQLGMEPDQRTVPVHGDVGGWMLVPAPARRPCRITAVTPMAGARPGPYAEALLAPGDVLPAADSYYEHVGGRFRFRGPSSGAVEDAIRATAARFRVEATPLAEVGRTAGLPWPGCAR